MFSRNRTNAQKGLDIKMKSKKAALEYSFPETVFFMFTQSHKMPNHNSSVLQLFWIGALEQKKYHHEIDKGEMDVSFFEDLP